MSLILPNQLTKTSLLFLVPFLSLIFFFAFKQNTANFDSSINQLCEDSDSLIENSNSWYFENSYFQNFESLYGFKDGVTSEVPRVISLLTPNAKSWYQNLDKIANQKNWDPDRFKDNFEAKIVIKNNEYLCTMNGKIRFTGDYWDHILRKNDLYISSLEVSINEGNILGNKKFKLFIPDTRNGENEIFMTTIFQELGFLAPTTFLVDINFNGENHEYLFQEKINAEFLQNNDMKEGPILESDTPPPYEWDKKSIDLARIVNETWLSQNDINLNYGFKALEIYSKLRIFHDQNNNSLIDLNYDKTNTISQSILRQFILINIALQNYHSLEVDDRKYYINPQNDLIIPIYYDGGSNFLNTKNLKYEPFTYGKNESYEEIILDDKFLKEIKILKEKVKKVDLKKLVNTLSNRGLSQDNLEFIEKNIQNELLERLDLIELKISNNHIKKENTIKEYFQKSPKNIEMYYLVFKKGEDFEFCDTNLSNCYTRSLTKNNQIQLMNGRFIIDNKKAYYVGENLESLYNLSSLNEIFKFKETINKVEIFSNHKISFDLKNQDSLITLKPENNSKYLIQNTTLDNVQIILSYDELSKLEFDNETIQARYDETFYTGCLNIYDSNLKNISLKVVNSPCEDSINIVRTKGEIQLLESSGSKFDSIDADFSEIKFINTLISNAGNDCIDISAGKYKFDSVNLRNCYDKGISIGENSIVDIDEVIVTNSNIGIAVKDSSKSYIDNYRFIGSEYCYAIYRKKEEFGPSKLIINDMDCSSSKTFFQSDSFIFVNDEK